MRSTLVFIVGILALSTAQAADDSLLKGTAAYGDWTKDNPGVRRLITVSDMPPPHETSSTSNGPRIVSQPAGAVPQVPAGFSVSPLLTDLKEPRQIQIAPNGDIFFSESGALRIGVIHIDKAGKTSTSVFADYLSARPYGIAFYPPGPHPYYLYVAVQDAVIRYPYTEGDVKARGPAEVIIPDLPAGGHWTRDVLFTEDGKKMLIAVGSGSNVAEDGMEAEDGRANILEYNPDGTGKRVYASGLRNPVTMAFNPITHALWTTVNERDTMGDNLPPDYVTSVTDNGFYGWPWYYIGAHQDKEHLGQHPELKDKVLTPDVLLQAHSAPLGLAFYTGSQFPAAYKGDLFVALHGSWNRAQRTGYKLVRVRFKDGKATGEYDDFLTGFVNANGNVWGRPVGVAMMQDGSLLMSDDASGTIWRITYNNSGK